MVGVRAQEQKEGGRERDEVSELEKALGIEKKTVRNLSADKNAPPRRLFLIPVPLFAFLSCVSLVRFCFQYLKASLRIVVAEC